MDHSGESIEGSRMEAGSACWCGTAADQFAEGAAPAQMARGCAFWAIGEEALAGGKAVDYERVEQ
eukprot:3714440-Prymnesium_polylepis.1